MSLQARLVGIVHASPWFCRLLGAGQSVGAVTRDAAGGLHVIAPHGLDDLFAMVVRRNPARVSVETYRQRVREKNYAARWPHVRVLA